jgi:hypothetical protein
MVCHNHPTREGNNLCLKCGNWFCADCMHSVTLQPSCKNCATGSVNPTSLDGARNYLLRFPNIKSLLHISLACSSFILLGIAFYFQTKYKINFIFIPFGISLLLQIPVALFLKASTTIAKSITRAQLDSLFRTSEIMTIKRLASATGTTEKIASDYLNKMVRENELVVSTNDSELIYQLPSSLIEN